MQITIELPEDIVVVARPSRQLSQEHLSSAHCDGCVNRQLCANPRYSQLPECSAPAFGGPPAVFLEERVRRTFAAPGRPSRRTE